MMGGRRGNPPTDSLLREKSTSATQSAVLRKEKIWKDVCKENLHKKNLRNNKIFVKKGKSCKKTGVQISNT
jgi:hypothetical protein